jgi:hypothetical protein
MNKFFMLVIVLIFAATSLFGVPYTSLGHVNTPDAYIMPHKMLELSYTSFIVADARLGNSIESSNVTFDTDNIGNFVASVRYGLANRFEVGFVYSSDKIYFGNLKIKIVHETETIPAISFGLTNIFSGVEMWERSDDPSMTDAMNLNSQYEITDPIDYIQNSPYLAITKSVVLVTGIPGMDYLETSFYGGIGLRRFQGPGLIVKNTQGIFGGIDLKPNNYVGLTLEWDTQNINLGINGYYKNLTLRMGLYELEDYFNIKRFDDDGIRNSSTKFAVNLKLAIDKFSDVKYNERNKVHVIKQRPKKTKYTPEYPEYDAAESTLSEELKQIRERRRQAEQELDEIRRLLQE